MKNFTKVLLLSVIMLLSSVFVFAQQMQISNNAPVDKTVKAPADNRSVLYEQIDLAGSGWASQDFEAAYDIYDNQGADDFYVPAGEDWNIQTVIAYGSGAPGPFNLANVMFYSDAGGIPAVNPFSSYMNIAATDNAGVMTMDLGAGEVLGSGHYWISVQDAAPFVTNGQWFWSKNNVVINDIAHWRNPSDAFGTGAITWTPVDIAFGETRDFAFTLDGVILVPCDYQISLIDQYGDGWNGGLVSVYVDGAAVLSNLTIASGAGPEYHTFSVTTGAEITTIYTPGSFAYENTYEIYDAGGNLVYIDGAGYVEPTGIGAGVLFGDCPTIGTLDGYVFNGDGLTIAGATVGIDGIGITTSGSDGYYMLDPVQSGQWDLNGWKEGYNLVTYNVTVSAGANTVQDIVLTQPGMVINPLQLNETLNPNEWLKDWLGILNTGDGPLDWTAVINYPPGDAASGSNAREVTTGKVPVFTKNAGPDKSVLSEKGGKPMIPSDATRDLFECNAGSLFANSPVGNTNAYYSQYGGLYQQYQQVNGISDAWNTVTFWGVFTSGTPTTADFFIGIYADGSVPGAEIASYMVTLDPVATGEVLLGSYPIYQWIATIDAQTETDFYISCQNVGSPQMYWLDSPNGTGNGVSGPAWSAHDPLALCIEGGGTPGGWLTLDSYEGTVAPMGGSYNLGVNFDATGFEAGTYVTADIVVSSDPNVGIITIPCSMTIMGDPLSPPTDLEVILANDIIGQVDLTWEWTADAFQYFTVYRDGVFVGTTPSMSYTDMLPDYGEYCYTVVAVYDEGQTSPAGPECVIWPNPTMVINPMSLYAEVWPDHTVMVQTNISSTGIGTLSYAFPDFVPGDDSRAYCTAASTYCDEYISNVTIGTINNSTGCTNYGDYTDMSTEVEVGEPSTITITIGSAWSSDQGAIWVDWNQNEDFYDDAPITVSGSPGYGPYTATIIPPEDALAGPTRMRVRLTYATTPDPCGNVTYGEVEDYTLIVTGGSFITIVDPYQGLINSGSNADIDITFDATDFDPGLYSEWLYVESNDPDRLYDSIFCEMFVYIPGQVEGYVTDGNTDDPIAGVNVVLGQWSTTTGPDGFYSLMLDAGTYDADFSVIGYQSVNVPGVVATQGVVTTLDVEMYEKAYAPGWVTATVNDDDTECDVEWALPWGPYEIMYDDGSADDYLVWMGPNNINAVKFTPAGYPATVIGGKVYVGDGSFPAGANFLGTDFEMAVFDDDGTGGLPGTKLDSIIVTVNNYGWVDFSGLFEIFTEGEFYLGMVQLGFSPYAAPIGVDYTIPTVYRSYNYDAAAEMWGLSAYQDFMLRAVISGPQSDALAADYTKKVYPIKPVKHNFISLHTPLGIPGYVKGGKYVAAPEYASAIENRDVVSYTIARFSDFDPNGSILLGTESPLETGIAGLTYNDAAFGGLAEGWYGYGVKAVYTNGDESPYTPSNIVGHDMKVAVIINVTTTTGENAEGTEIILTGFDYPEAMYTAVLDNTQTVTFDPVWKGNYNVYANKVGYEIFSVDYNIKNDKTIDIMLAETKYAPYNLYVDPLTSIATWNEPRITQIKEDFEGVFPPDGWQMTTNSVGWFATSDGSSASWTIPSWDSQYACANDDAAGSLADGSVDYLITPQLDLRESPDFSVKFDSYYDGGFGQLAFVEYSLDAGATWEVLAQMSASTSWEAIELDLAAFSGLTGESAIWLAFHADDAGAWASGWAIDNVEVSVGNDSDFPPQGYHVFLDDVYAAVVTETTYTYIGLVYGQTYTASVAALYSSGLSEKDYYTFTSEYLYPPRNLMDEYVLGTNEVPLYWNPPITATLSFSDVDNGPVVGTKNHSLRAAPESTINNGSIPSSIEFFAGRDAHTGYFMDISADQLYSMDMLDYSYTLIGSTVIDASTGDFMNDDTDVWYTTGNWGTELYSVDIATGTATLIGNITGAGDDISGMACDRATNTMYVAWTDISVSGIGTIDLTTGVVTPIGAEQSVAPGIIDIAIDGAGQMYAWCIVNDNSYTIDKSTGDVTLLGSLGVNINYGQGGNWDQEDDVIYMTAYTTGSELRALDITTGGTSLVQPLFGQCAAFGVPGIGSGGPGGGNVPDGLLSFNVYRDNDFIANVLYDGEEPEDWIMHIDNNLMPTCFDYEVTAVYDLTDFGFPGETAESGVEGPHNVCLSYGYELPFVEEWSLGLFETQQWTVGCDNWIANSTDGNPLPAAEFKWDPSLTDYDCGIETYPLLGSEIIDGSIYLDFDYKLLDRNATALENLTVRLWENGTWHDLATYTNEGDIDWTPVQFNINSLAKGNNFKIGFFANGASSVDILGWYIDNINVYRVCEAPTDLAFVQTNFTDYDEIVLSWLLGDPPIEEWIQYDDGTNDGNAIGLEGGGAFEVSAYWPASSMAAYTGFTLTEVEVYINDPTTTAMIKIYGAGTATVPGALLAEKSFDGTAASWITVVLDSPVMITGEDMWIGYYGDAPATGAYFAGCDPGPAIAGFGDMLSMDGITFESMYIAYDLDYNWNIHGFLTNTDGEVTALKPIEATPVTYTGGTPTVAELNSAPNVAPFNHRDFVSFSIFRNGELLEEGWVDYTYTDLLYAGGDYTYYVTAVYDQCESDPSNEVTVACFVGVEELTLEESIEVYPNPAIDYVNVNSTIDINTIIVLDYLGQVVYEMKVVEDNSLQLNTASYEAGIYFIKVYTEEGIAIKRVAITR